ncbi:MAG: hypothetical protein AB1568_13785 [Thermodesulfobacteriota bacterium]
MDFRDKWNTEMAVAILASESVAADTWVEAVRWLLLYGPAEVRHVLVQASIAATSRQFPDLVPTSYSPGGEPVYALESLAAALGLPVEELAEVIEQTERRDDGRERSPTVH